MKRMLACFLVLACVCTLFGCKRSNPTVKLDHLVDDRYVLAMTSYPEMAPYPDEMDFVDEKTGEFDEKGFAKAYELWQASQDAQQNQPKGYADSLDGFFQKTLLEYLSNSQGENRAISPVNVYLALAMLAEVTGGNSRQQILALLEADSIASLRGQADSVWNASYCNDGAVTSLLANSMWLSERMDYNQDTMDTLAETYHACAFSGVMGSPDYDKALQSWVQYHTGGQLEAQAEKLHMDPATVLALVSTCYFQGEWNCPFSEENTQKGMFHGAKKDVQWDFMHQEQGLSYYTGERFAAVAQSMKGTGKMWLILPDQETSVTELLQDGQVIDFLDDPVNWIDCRYATVHLAVPKFDIASDLDLISGLQNLGVTDIFDEALSDFSSMLQSTQTYTLSKAEHSVRIKVDERGAQAAANTTLMATEACLPPEKSWILSWTGPFCLSLPARMASLCLLAW